MVFVVKGPCIWIINTVWPKEISVTEIFGDSPFFLSINFIIRILCFILHNVSRETYPIQRQYKDPTLQLLNHGFVHRTPQNPQHNYDHPQVRSTSFAIPFAKFPQKHWE